ncbi:hypothetical protein AB0C21_26515 [Spirillospora sp. NPDC049024]
MPADDAGAAFFAFFTRVVADSTDKKMLVDALADAGVDVKAGMDDLHRDMVEAIEALLVRARAPAPWPSCSTASDRADLRPSPTSSGWSGASCGGAAAQGLPRVRRGAGRRGAQAQGVPGRLAVAERRQAAGGGRVVSGGGVGPTLRHRRSAVPRAAPHRPADIALGGAGGQAADA